MLKGRGVPDLFGHIYSLYTEVASWWHLVFTPALTTEMGFVDGAGCALWLFGRDGKTHSQLRPSRLTLHMLLSCYSAPD